MMAPPLSRADPRSDGEPVASPTSPPSRAGGTVPAGTPGPRSRAPGWPGVRRRCGPGLERSQDCAGPARGRLDHGRRAERCLEGSPSGRPRRSGRESRGGSRGARGAQSWSRKAFGDSGSANLDPDRGTAAMGVAIIARDRSAPPGGDSHDVPSPDLMTRTGLPIASAVHARATGPARRSPGQRARPLCGLGATSS